MQVNGKKAFAGVSAAGGTDPIAIIGIGCRYPGCANVEELWQNLLAGKDLIEHYPGGRFPELDRAYLSSREKPGPLFTDQGGFVAHVDAFDSQFFEISPRESVYIDPQHRLLMEVAWDALEDAGLVREQYEGSRTGVFAGLWTSEYESRIYESGNDPDFYSITGCARASASGRVSYTFGFEGPSVTVDSACSSSLVAVHLACQSLWSGESELALAGGANLILGPEISELFTKASMLSPDGRCKFGDASANGFVRSEGAGMIVLKRLSRARKDGDRIYALIRGSATNNDGRTSGLLVTPSRPGQRQMLLSAWKAADIDPARLCYIEAHGTGTSVGDPVEIGAIADALMDNGVKHACALGSIKSNFGHTEAASGVAGLIKAALIVQHRTIPPSLHCKTPNPKIEWNRAPVRVATETIDLGQQPSPLLAGVSSFGITGTNAHIVLEEAGAAPAVEEHREEPLILPLSARSPEALEELLRGYLKQLREDAAERSLAELCYTASVRRNHHEFRRAIVSADVRELEERMAAAVEGEVSEGVAAGRSSSESKRIVFVAPGQGSQWLGMARELYEQDAAFREAFDECDRAIFAETGWSLVDRVLGAEAERYLSEIDVIQPALFTMSVALAALWRSWGVEPDAVVGHSMGEVAAVYLAGVLPLTDAAAVICRRSRLMKTVRSSGGMATIDLPLEATAALLREIPSLSVAASNGPRTTVISGDLKALEELLAELQSKEIYCRLVKVDVASHSSQVDPILDSLRESLSEIHPRSARVPMISTVTGECVSPDNEIGVQMNSDYWVRNLRQCVLLAPAITRLTESGHNIFIELSPHPILLPSIESAAKAINPQVLAVASLRREKPARAAMLSSLSAMYAEGYRVAWERFYPHGGRCVSLPQYPFQRERCWPEPGTQKRWESANREGNPLLGRQFTSSRQPGTILWESEISIAAIPYLTDHRVMRAAVFPASGYLEMALSGARALLPDQSFEISKAAFVNAAHIPETGARIFQLAITPEGGDGFAFEIRSREPDDTSWVLHATGRLKRIHDSGKTGDGKEDTVSIDDLKARYGAVSRDRGAFYEGTARGGLHYGPRFQLVDEAWVGEGEALCGLRADAEDRGRYVIHPAVLDACFQSMAVLGPVDAAFRAGDTYLPVGIERICIYENAAEQDQIFAQASLAEGDPEKGVFRINLRLLDGHGATLVDVSGMEVRRVARQDASDSRDALYTMRWVLQTASGDPELPKVANAHWVVFADCAGIAYALKTALEFAGGHCTLVRSGSLFKQVSESEFEVRPDSREDLERLLTDAAANHGPPGAAVHLWALDSVQDNGAYDATGLIRSQQAGSHHIPLVVQAISNANWQQPPRLWLVTGGSMAVDGEKEIPRIEHAPMWGIGRTVAREHPELQATLVDLSAAPDATEALALARHIVQNGREDRIALRGGKRYVARLGVHASAEPANRALAEGEEYRFEIQNAGVLDNLTLRAFTPQPPGPGEVAIEVAASGLNFIDVAKAMGIYPGLDPGKPVGLGLECSGRVVAVGQNVTGIATGDEVIAVAPSAYSSLLASRVTIPAEWILRKPAGLSFEEAATTSITFLTAYYSLAELGRMRPGDWVLIHAAAGGVGIAAIQIAMSAGAHVIATVGSKEKEEFVRSLGVSHVFNSRSVDFADGVMEVTERRGVDIVLNSLTGEFIAQGLKVLAPYGRFIELGKRDIYENRQIGLFAFRKNISFHAVDLAAALEERPQHIYSLLQSIVRRIADGDWRPAPVTTFSATEPSEAFRYMAQARHIGKVAVRTGRDVHVMPNSDAPLFQADASYLITGGLGGIALKVAEWMAGNGAGHLVLVSRRAVEQQAAEAIGRIEAAGATVQVMRADITREDEIDRVVWAIRDSGAALKGVMHAAAVMDVALIRDLSPEQFRSVMAPKVEGTWRLHEATLGDNLDFFVLFSSIGAIHPQPGMGNYASANAFLDAFAHYRRAHGLPATSINWGVWAGTGLALTASSRSFEDSIEDYVQQGLGKLSVEEGLRLLGTAIRSDAEHLIAVPYDWKRLAEFYGAGQAPLLYAEFTSETATGPGAQDQQSEILQLLHGAGSVERRTEIMEAYLQETLSAVLKLAARKIDRERPMGTMGLDSLMGLEFVRRLSKGLEIPIPATVVFNYPTVRALAPHLLQRLPLTALIHVPSEDLADQTDQDDSFALLPVDISEEEALEALIGGKGNTA